MPSNWITACTGTGTCLEVSIGPAVVRLRNNSELADHLRDAVTELEIRRCDFDGLLETAKAPVAEYKSPSLVVVPTAGGALLSQPESDRKVAATDAEWDTFVTYASGGLFHC